MFIPIGYGNFVESLKVVAVLRPDSDSARRLRQGAELSEKLLNATNGGNAKSIIVMESSHVVLSALQPRILTKRLNGVFYFEKKIPFGISL